MQRTILKQFLNYNLNRSTNLYFGTWSSLAAAFNSRPDRKLNFSLKKENAGLFDIPELQSCEGFYYIKEQCILHADKLIDEATSENRTRKMVEVFDELSDSLCKVADLAEFIRVAHPSAIYMQAAEIALATVSSLVEKLNTNSELYYSLLNVINNGDKIPTDEVDNHVAKLFSFDFEQSGIHLPDVERHKVVNLNDSLLRLGQYFVAGSTNPRHVRKDALPESVRHIFSMEGDDIVVDGLCVDSANSKVRELAYRIYFQPNDHQDYLLTEMLKARYELAQTCGFPTYAHRALKESAIETPEMVMEFLDCLSDGLKERARNDFYIMSEMKRNEYLSNSPLAPWDIPYFRKKARKQMFNVQNSEYSPYFSLGACMEGLDNLLHCLYGINLVIKEIVAGECWAQDIYKLAVMHETEGLLGYIYCDFYERTRKPNQDCHFTIQGGRMLSDGSYQLPIVVLMLNLPLPRWSSPTLLSPTMVDNLLHEMGHAMHSMLARTCYQHVTGTRCSTDIAEVPSVLMEYFASDIRILKSFARHFQTKEPMPDDMLQHLCASKYVFTASEIEHQLFYSALDQLYHARHPLNGSTTNVLVEAQAKYYSLPYVNNTAWQLRFSHLVGYGAKYYSYLMSRALASCIWQNYFKQDPLNRIQGERYRRECLAHGGGKPPRQLVADFLRKQPTSDVLVDSLLKDIDDKQKQIVEIQRKC
ncbi:hypothetical protein ILUMI_05032 [Ignelater luminosus]|uniref:Peptidase M3A/M3B catalytic domain-containing protein n=1 Tax=Ignelater luminosus TaxID=2038154 RepID=A0A8K0GJ12_IGNLU|nr:hypothetical protein ILUMI_05032 [Ignelater luminosus]